MLTFAAGFDDPHADVFFFLIDTVNNTLYNII